MENDETVPSPAQVASLIGRAMQIGGFVYPQAVPGWVFTTGKLGQPIAIRLNRVGSALSSPDGPSSPHP
jgi:hypothetical protein